MQNIVAALPNVPTFYLQISTKKGADERTRTADLTSLRVIIQVLQGFASMCNLPISIGFSIPLTAVRCTLLRSRRCQSGVKKSQRASRASGSTYKQEGDLRRAKPLRTRKTGATGESMVAGAELERATLSLSPTR
jgi:hypothetical protein